MVIQALLVMFYLMSVVIKINVAISRKRPPRYTQGGLLNLWNGQSHRPHTEVI